MTVSEGDLRSRIGAAAKPRARRAKKEWVAPTAEDFAEGSVLTFDQTLTHTGWSVLHSLRGRVWVTATGMCIPSSTDLKGLVETLWRAEQIYEQIYQVMSDHHHSVDFVVHEMPAVVGYRLESSLMAAREVQRAWLAVSSKSELRPVYNQHMEKVLLHPDDRRVDKKRHVKEAVHRHVDLSLLPRGSRLNEHVHDGMALGVTDMYDRKRQDDIREAS